MSALPDKETPTMLFPFREELADLQPYPPGKPIEEVQREHGLTEVVKLASNENPYGPSPLAVEAIAGQLKDLHLYPESGCYYLRNKLAGRLGVAPENLIFGNGSDEIVALLAMAFLDNTHNIVCSERTFIRYEMGATSMGATTRHVPMRDWKHDVDALAAAVDNSTRFLFLANPDNPVGSAVPAVDVRRLLETVPSSIIVVLDEAYYEYARAWDEYPDSVQWLTEFPNLVITRTFSKAYGLAGIRVGYAMGNPEIWNAVDRVRPPFNVNRLAQEAAMAAMDDHGHLARTVDGNAEGLAFFYNAFQGLGLEYVQSYANFVLVNMKRPALPVYESLLRHGVIVRPMGIYKLPEHLRISVGLQRENEIFIDALTDVLKS